MSKFKIGVKVKKTRFWLEVTRESTAQELHDFIKTNFRIKDSDFKHITIQYQGTFLKLGWRLVDLGICEGSVLKARIEPIEIPVVRIKTALTSTRLRLFNLMPSEHFKTNQGGQTLVANIKSQICIETGLHPCTFKLSTCKSTTFYNQILSGNKDDELLDCHTLDYYKLSRSSIIRLRFWNGWIDLISASISGNHDKVSKHLDLLKDPYERRHQALCSLTLAKESTFSVSHFLRIIQNL